MYAPGLPFPVILFGLAGRLRWPAIPAMPKVSLVPWVPCLIGAAAAMLLGSSEWCHGQVRLTLAVCLGGAGASATLLLCWWLYPETMRRSAASALIGGLLVALPLLSFA